MGAREKEGVYDSSKNVYGSGRATRVRKGNDEEEWGRGITNTIYEASLTRRPHAPMLDVKNTRNPQHHANLPHFYDYYYYHHHQHTLSLTTFSPPPQPLAQPLINIYSPQFTHNPLSLFTTEFPLLPSIYTLFTSLFTCNLTLESL